MESPCDYTRAGHKPLPVGILLVSCTGQWSGQHWPVQVKAHCVTSEVPLTGEGYSDPSPVTITIFRRGYVCG